MRRPTACRRHLVAIVLVVAALAGSAGAAVPPIPQPVAVPATLPWTVRQPLESQRAKLVAAGAALATAIAEHDGRCSTVPSDAVPRLAACSSALPGLQKRYADHRAALAAFEAAVNEAVARAVVQGEQDEFDKMNEAWLRAQAQLIRDAQSTGRAWRTAMLDGLKSNAKVPEPAPRPKTVDDALPGDILLFEPAPGYSAAIPPADYFYRVASDLARGDVLGALGRQRAPVSHALTYVKRVGTVMLFLDHTPEGSRILDRRELTRRYAGRKMYLARPQMAPDGRVLWAAARQAALRNAPYYGVLPGQQVCSDQACIVVSKATGVPLTTDRLGPIDITPADFFDPEAIGKYFIVSPLEKPL